MEESHLILKRALEKAGIKTVASALHLSIALIYKWCQDTPRQDKRYNSSGTPNPLDRLRQIYEITLDVDLINWICQIADGFFVPNPKKDTISADESFLNSTQKLILEFSEVLQTISDSFNNDRKITPDEALKIRKEWEDIKRIGESLTMACESGFFNKSSGG